MKRPLLFSALMCAGLIQASAGINTADAQGYLERSIQMITADRNYAGAIDQLSRLSSLPCTPAQREDALYYMALANLNAGYDEALPMLEAFLERYPVSTRRAEVRSLIADYWFDRADYSKAVALYAQIDPMAVTQGRQDKSSFRTGYCYMMLGEPDEAASYFRSLLGKPQWRNAAQFYLGYIAYGNKNYTEARRYFSRVDTSTSPGDAAPYYLAQIDFAEGRYESALAGARSLLSSGKVKEFIPECNRLAGESLYNLGRTSEAEPYLWKYAAETASPAPSAYYILGTGEWDRGDVDATIKLLQQAIGQHSAMEQSAWLYLGQAYMKRGDKSCALMAFENAYRMDYDPKVREEAFYNYAVARMDGGRVPFGNSVALLQDFLRDYPDSQYADEVQRYIIEGYMTEGDYESALRSIRTVRQPSPEMLRAKQRALFVLGTRGYAAGNTGAAIRDLTEARAISGDPSVARQCDLWLGDCYYQRANYPAAASSYLAFLKAAPSSETEHRALARYGLGYTRFAEEKYADAATDFTDAARLAADLPAETRSQLLPDIESRLGDCAYYLNDYTAALGHYDRAASLNPSAADYPLFQTAMMKGRLSDYKGKVETIDLLISRFPSSGLIPGALLEKAESLLALSRPDDAAATYERLIRDYPASASGRNGYLQLAILQTNQGRKDKAIATYRSVITSYPTSEEARVAIDDLKGIYAAEGKLDEFVAFMKSVPDAPQLEASDIESAAWQAAENAYLNQGSADRIGRYVNDYPRGTYRARGLYYLAEDAWNGGDSRAALDHASQLLLTYPDSESAEDALLIKARAESAMGKTELAHSSFRQLEAKADGSNMLRDARLGIIETAMDLGRYAEAAEYADKVLSSTASTAISSTAPVRFARARANDALGNFDKAYADYAILEKDMRDTYGARAAYYHAQSLFDRGRTADAERTADALISSDTPQAYWLARGFILYSDILRKQDKTFEANEYLRSLRSNYPGTEADIFEMIDSRINK